MSDIRSDTYQRTVQDFANLYREGQLNLEPGFQRDSVWTDSDRVKLLDSIMRNYPLPSVFLYRREEDGQIVYDVIDGKQRLETILRFMGLKWGQRFRAKVQLPDEEAPRTIDWRRLCRECKQPLLTGYSLHTVEVRGDLADIIDLFVRINSTGKALTSAEKRHARYYKSRFLREAGKLAERYEGYFLQHRILSAMQLSRMKHVELVCELMISLHQGDLINKKAALDHVMQSATFTPRQIEAAKKKTIRTMNLVAKVFPGLKQSRFRQVSDYYSLAVLISKFDTEGLVLSDRRRNKLAWGLLAAFSSGVDTVRDLQKQAKGTPPQLESERQYLLTVTGGTDHIAQRRTREGILRGLLESVFEKKDSRRGFSPEQRRILWASSSTRKCKGCGRLLTWGDFTIDHINPFSKGGQTALSNAALMCRSCNSSKGNRTR